MFNSSPVDPNFTALNFTALSFKALKLKDLNSQLQIVTDRV